MASATCFPAPQQEQALRACFLPAAVARFPGGSAPPSIQDDPAAAVLLPLLIWRWSGVLPSDLATAAEAARLAIWLQWRERLALSAQLAATLGGAGIDPVFLKGVALIAKYYPDPRMRAISDVDLLVPREQTRAAAEALLRAGWRPEDGLAPEQIQSHMRARHAWQFVREGPDGQPGTCDLHWHPVVRCYSPRLAGMFLEGAETVETGSGILRIPCATDLLFHVLAHGLQSAWSTPIRWIPDAWFVLRSGAVDWRRLRDLCAEGGATFRVHRALHYLKTRFDAPVPDEELAALAHAPAWESREQTILEKPFPLGLADAARWHLFNFRRLRQFDPAWRGLGAVTGFPSYLALFFDAHRSGLSRAVWHRVRARLQPALK